MTDATTRYNDQPHEGLRAEIIEAIKTVFDPEIPVDIWELGLIYDIRILGETEVEGVAKATVEVIMTLTSPLCPVAGSMPFEVKEKVESVDGVASAEIEMTYEPSWSKDLMSDVARVELDMF